MRLQRVQEPYGGFQNYGLILGDILIGSIHSIFGSILAPCFLETPISGYRKWTKVPPAKSHAHGAPGCKDQHGRGVLELERSCQL